MDEDEEELKQIYLNNDEFAGLIGDLAGNFIRNQVGGDVGQILGGLIRDGGRSMDRGISSWFFHLKLFIISKLLI